MSISIDEARRKLNVLEEISKKPDLILTELFSETVSGLNFLYQINIDGKYIIDYLLDYLNELDIFNDCILEQSGWNIKVNIKALKSGKYQKFESDDMIFKINLNDKTYRDFNDCIKEYEDIMNTKYTYKEQELDIFWKKFINPTYKQRIQYAVESFYPKTKTWIKLSNFIFWLTFPNSTVKKIKEKIDEEQEKINSQNKYNLEKYDEDIERQKLYLEKAPNHINNIKIKQKEIEEYLKDLGYKKDSNMSPYN